MRRSAMLRLTQAARAEMPFTGVTPGRDRAGNSIHRANHSAAHNCYGSRQVELQLSEVQAARAAVLPSCLGCKLSWQQSAGCNLSTMTQHVCHAAACQPSSQASFRQPHRTGQNVHQRYTRWQCSP